MMYQIWPPSPIDGSDCGIWLLNDAGQSILSIPYDASNTDYQTFKSQINDKSAQLETYAEVVMTPDEAIAYVATLP